MRDLPQVTLACIDTANHALALRALARSSSQLRFAHVRFLTDALPADLVVPAQVEVTPIAPILSREDYSQFVLKALAAHVTTSHVLLVQWDGYVANADAWDDAFLDVDYIGARWFWYDDGMQVGNGGFSLRSRRLLDALADPRVVLTDAEDLTICRTFRPWLEQEHAIRFADAEMADRFAFEAAYPIGKPFGFHGLFNFCRTVPPGELAALAEGFSDAIARSRQCRSLLRNCLALAQWQAAAAIAQRVLLADPDAADAAAALVQAQGAAARGIGIGRNDPCPCGSGKRYKQCHGLTPPPVATKGAIPQPQPQPPPPQSIAAIVERGMKAHRGGDLAGAEQLYREALATAPDNPLAVHYLGVLHYQRGQFDAALPLLDRAIALLPEEPEFHNNRGQALAAMQRLTEAEASYRRALALKPDHALSWNNLGLTLQAGGDAGRAIDAFHKALQLAPEFAQGHWNLALALLLQGNYTEGFGEYEWRLRVPELAARLPAVAGTRWKGDDPSGKTILLTVEQGLGDTLQNLRFCREVADRGARVIVATPSNLLLLAASAPGVAQVIDNSTQAPRYDEHASLMSLPGLLGTTYDTVPARTPYLAAQVQRVTAVRAKVAEAAGGALRVGIAWTGAGTAYNLRRACPLAILAPLLEIDGVRWFSLHRESEAIATSDVAHAAGLVALPERNDLDGTSALVTALDLVISVDTSLAHLAGALGTPVWILLPFAPDWRWRESGTSSAWYPHATLFRQEVRGDWSGPIHGIAEALRRLVADRR
jgi:tetratricopeptide (TPR) repeat protein